MVIVAALRLDPLLEIVGTKCMVEYDWLECSVLEPRPRRCELGRFKRETV